MGSGYSVLLFDGYGAGLVMKNPRFLHEGFDLYGNPQNWWPCEYETSDEEIAKERGLDALGVQYRIIR